MCEESTEQTSEQKHDEATTGTGEPMNECWQAYVDQILMPIAVSPTREGYAPKAVMILDNGQITRSFEFAQDGNDALKLQPSEFIGLDLSKELFVSVEWLYQFKQSFLLGIETYKALLLCHLVLLLSLIAVFIAYMAQ